MIRKDAIRIVSKLVGDSPIISANGFISRDLFDVSDKDSNFYMIIWTNSIPLKDSPKFLKYSPKFLKDL